MPIPDLRTVADREVGQPSPDLLDTIYLCQQRQEWYRDFARKAGEPKRAFVGSAIVTDKVEGIATQMRDALGFDLDERRRMPTWTDALRRFIEQADALGVLVMVSGVVGANNRRKLDPEEFRGFASATTWRPSSSSTAPTPRPRRCSRSPTSWRTSGSVSPRCPTWGR